MRLLPLKLLSAALLLVLAVTSAHAQADTITRSFNAKGNIEPGQVVAQVINDKNSVELAPASDPNRIYGVAVDPSAPPVTASQPGQNIFVVTAGTYPVVVSSENGSIAAGDYLSMSSTDGIAARATGQAFVLGRATQSFDGHSGAIGTAKSGSPIGKISVAIAPGRNPLLREDTAVPSALRRLAEAIAGKQVSAARIYASLAIFLVTAAVAFGLLFVGVRSGMIAIGRNPLSRHSIMQSLAQVIIASAIVFVGGIFGIYLFLRI